MRCWIMQIGTANGLRPRSIVGSTPTRRTKLRASGGMADALGLSSSIERCTSSTLVGPTKQRDRSITGDYTGLLPRKMRVQLHAGPTKFAWLVEKSIFNRGSEPLLFPENGIVKIYGPSVYGAMILAEFRFDSGSREMV